MRERQPPHTRGVSKVARAVWEGPLPPARLRASDLLVSREQASFSCLLLSHTGPPAQERLAGTMSALPQTRRCVNHKVTLHMVQGTSARTSWGLGGGR